MCVRGLWTKVRGIEKEINHLKARGLAPLYPITSHLNKNKRPLRSHIEFPLAIT